MHPAQHEIVLLKPTAAFLSFIALHLPEIKLPDLKLLQIDNTAYVLPKQSSNEATLDLIEKDFATMFRHEIYRWFGDKVPNEIESNFLDFLCCFKFEFHNHIILMEPAMEKSHQLLLLKPRLVLCNWVKAVVEGQDDLMDVIDKVELVSLEENTTALVKNFSNLTAIKPFIKEYYPFLFSIIMKRTLTQSVQWPLVDSWQAFSRYFAVEIHTQLIHLPHS